LAENQAISIALAPEHGDRLHVRREQELVDRCDAFKDVAAVEQNARVPRQRTRIAGHADRDRNARACQLLANGYRFHKSEAVCDGQALLVETVGDIADLLTQIRTR